MDLALLKTFYAVAERASFTQAAEKLGLPKSRVSASVRQLEAELGTRLLHRTTRTVRLTPDGEELLERSRSLLAEAEEIQALFQRQPASLRGKLRADVPTAVARNVLIPRLPEFLADHPLLELELSTTDRRVDPVGEAFDCVLRIGQLGDSRLVARRLGEMAMVNCASPAYIAQFGMPLVLDDLDRHRMVRYAPTPGGAWVGWEYRSGRDGRDGRDSRDGERSLFRDVPGIVTVTDTEAYRAACLAGLGLIQVPRIGVAAALAEGSLVEVLPDDTAAPMPVSLLYPDRHQLAKRVAAFMQWLTEVMTPYLALSK